MNKYRSAKLTRIIALCFVAMLFAISASAQIRIGDIKIQDCPKPQPEKAPNDEPQRQQDAKSERQQNADDTKRQHAADFDEYQGRNRPHLGTGSRIQQR